jgi:hypothetical protein
MNRAWVWIVALGAFVSTGAAGADDAPPAPRIVCDEPSFDFGTVESHQPVEHTFILKNEGTAPLEIANARTSCGCTVASISEKIVPPGGKSEVRATLSLVGRIGQQHKTITIESNDPNNRNLTLFLNGAAASAIDVTPDRITFSQVAAGTVSTAEVVLAATGTNSFKILRAESTSPAFAADVSPIEEGRKYRVAVRMEQSFQPESPGGQINVQTDDPARPTIAIPVSCSALAEIIVAPVDILLSANSTKPVMRTIHLKPGTGPAFQVVSVEPPSGDMKVQVLPWEDGYRVVVDNIPPDPALNGKTVRITTSAQFMKEILVPFRVLLTPAKQREGRAATP